MNREKLEESLKGYGIPKRMHHGIIDYVLRGIEPGGFLSAVIIDSLSLSFMRADEQNRRLIENYVNWFHNYPPSACWGPREKMKAWIEKINKEREDYESKLSENK